MNRWWYEGKRVVLDHLALSTNAAHAVLGLAVFLCLAWVMRAHPRGQVFALAAVAALQLLNEALDALDWIGWTGGVNWTEALSDTAYTLTLPAALVLIRAASRVRRTNDKERRLLP